jgi:hypothetical protein
MAEEIYAFEELDGIRMPWNFWPRSKMEALKCVLPFSAMYTPLKPTRNLQVRFIALCKAFIGMHMCTQPYARAHVCPGTAGHVRNPVYTSTDKAAPYMSHAQSAQVLCRSSITRQ